MGKHKKPQKIVLSRAILLALKEMAAFPDLEITKQPIQNRNGWIVETRFAVSLPSRSIKAGISFTKVKEFEPVFFRFPANYPRKAPAVF